MAAAVFERRTIQHSYVGDTMVLDAVAALDDANAGYVFCHSGASEQLTPSAGTNVDTSRTISDALILNVVTDDGVARFHTPEGEIERHLSAHEHDLFHGLNTALAIRNAEDAQATLAWLGYHVKHHDLEAVVILDRAAPGTDESYADSLSAGLATIKGLKRVVLVNCDAPLGDPTLPPESHPFSTPGAPGKDRMEVPDADPWTSPIAELQVIELLRRRFLDTARAVALLDISDLLTRKSDGANIFDAAVESSSGCLVLLGRHCYPWRVRKGRAPHYGDHICVQFDATRLRRRWCVAPAKAGPSTVWRLVRVVGTNPRPQEWAGFWRCMGLRHPTDSVARIVPKTSLIEEDTLVEMATRIWDQKPVRMPELSPPQINPEQNSTTIITCMKNEGPFILEWLAYHRAIGVEGFLVYTNDCTDGTDTFLDLLQAKGLVQHRENPFKGTGLKPQHAALKAGEDEPIVRDADWVVSMDVDEFINIKTGDGTLRALFDAVPDANMIAMTWRLFGNSDIHEYQDEPLIGAFTRCAEELTRKPHQAWGFKTLFRNIGLFKKLGVHRPKGLNPQLWNYIRWVNGSGKPLPKTMFRNAWRSTSDTYGYDLVQLNHYAVRSAESFLVKRDRGRVNHVDRDQGLAYWFRMNNNLDEDRSITRMLPVYEAERARLLEDPEIAAAHAACVAAHRAKIDELRSTENYANFYADLTGDRLQRLSRMHQYFGANVFLAGPEVVPDNVIWADHPEDYFFTVERQNTAH